MYERSPEARVCSHNVGTPDVKTAIRRMGNSHGIIIPKPLLAELGVGPDNPVDIRVKKGRIVIEPIKKQPRAGWARESKAIHAAGEDELTWLEIPSDDGKGSAP
jgi:antitoxin MazE